jgi:hypothetical protein
MRVATRQLGIGQTNTGLIATTGQPGYTGLTCNIAGGVWVPATALCNLPSVTSPAIPVPNNYSNVLANGVIPGNTLGQTEANLPSNAPDLCSYQGGTWNPSTGTCDLSALCSLPLGTYDEDTNTCDYTNLYLALGGAAAVIVLLVVASSGGRRR